MTFWLDVLRYKYKFCTRTFYHKAWSAILYSILPTVLNWDTYRLLYESVVKIIFDETLGQASSSILVFNVIRMSKISIHNVHNTVQYKIYYTAAEVRGRYCYSWSVRKNHISAFLKWLNIPIKSLKQKFIWYFCKSPVRKKLHSVLHMFF